MYALLMRITDFDTAYNRQSRIHHFGHVGVDLSGLPTPEAYLALAQRLGLAAVHGEAGTYVKPRGNGDLAIYVDNPLTRMHSHNQGIFMVVRSRGTYGTLATMFAPKNGKAYFDNDDQLLI